MIVGFEGVEEIGHGRGEIFAADAACDRSHVLLDLRRVVGVVTLLGLAAIDHGHGGVGSALGLAGATHELLVSVVAVPAVDVGNGVEYGRFLMSPGLGIRGGVFLRELNAGAHGNVFVDHGTIVVVPVF